MLPSLANRWIWIVVCAIATTFQSSNAHGAIIVSAGYDLLYSSGTNVLGVDFVGTTIPNPPGTGLGSFDFGSGLVNIGQTNIIVQRMSAVSLADLPTLASQSISLKVAAFSFQSANALDFSASGGTTNEFIRTVFVSDNGSTMKIYNNPFDPVPNPDVFGRYDSTLSFRFKLQGVTSGALSNLITRTVSQTGALWTHDAVSNPDPVLIAGVNWRLNGSDTSTDFHSGLAQYANVANTLKLDAIDINAAAVPEPGSMVLCGLGLGFVAAAKYRRRNSQRSSKRDHDRSNALPVNGEGLPPFAPRL